MDGATSFLRSATFVADDEAAAVELLHRRDRTDGLPVVVPTRERVERMLLGIDLDPDVSIGTLGPSNDDATIEKIAINAVMAGCLPDHMAILVAAVEAVADPRFNLGAIQATTFASAPLVIVNGPARNHVGIACGAGAMGPGHRANASIGRALRLVLMNVGRGRPGTGDMGLQGTPAGFSFCLGEAQEESPFEPLHVARGFAAGDDVVTVMALEAPRSVQSVPETGQPQRSADRMLTSIASSLANVGSNHAHTGRGEVLVALNPLHARVLAEAGLDRAAVQQALYERARNPRSLLRHVMPYHVTDGPDDDLPIVADPGEIAIVVVGGDGLYSSTMTAWSGGPEGCVSISRRVRVPEPCDV